MDDGEWSRPIEVELVSHAPARKPRAWRRRSTDGLEAPDPTVDGDPPVRSVPPGLLATERSRLLAAAAAVGAVALLLGWVLGRAGGNEANDSATAAVSTVTTVDVRPTAALDAIDDVRGESEAAEEERAADREARRPPTTAFSPIIVTPTVGETAIEDVAVHESLQGLPIEIVARGSGRRLVSLDLAMGVLTSQTIDGQPFGPSVLYVGDGWVLLPSWDGELGSTLLVDGSEPRSVELGPAWALFGVDETDTFWRLDERVRSGFSGTAEEYRFDGVATGVTLELPTYPDRIDPSGGLVVSVPGGVYRVAPGATTKITDGEVIGLGVERALVHECDASLVCRYVSLDRDTGERADLGLDPDVRLRPSWWQQVTMAPDESIAVAAWSEDGRDIVGLVDLESGSLTEVLETVIQSPLAWSPDGRFLFFLEGGWLHAYDVAAQASIRVADELFGLETFALRLSTTG